MEVTKPARSVVIFDLGGVLVDWNPRYLYRKLFNGDEGKVNHFLTHIATPDWNEQQDAGRTFAEGGALLKENHPEHAEMIDAWLPGYPHMLGGEISGTVEILRELHDAGIATYALSNWSGETFHHAEKQFEFLKLLRGIVISGPLKMIKPDPRIYRHLLARYNIDPHSAIYVDDNPKNVAAGEALGMEGVVFTTPEALRQHLICAGLLSNNGIRGNLNSSR